MIPRHLLGSVTAALVVNGCVSGNASPDSTASRLASGSGAGGSACAIGTLALANLGSGACSTNTLGGMGFETSCTGNGGSPEYWCSDFARWTWQSSGADVGGLTAAAGSFYTYGQAHGTLSNTPSVGDAVVFDYGGNGYADHVAIVTQVNSDGTIETVSGDWNGDCGTEAQFASTSHTILNSPAYPGTVGTEPSPIGMTISGFVSPSGLTACAGGGSGGNPDGGTGGGGGTNGPDGGGAGGQGGGGTAGQGAGGTGGQGGGQGGQGGSGGASGGGSSSGGSAGSGGYSFIEQRGGDRHHAITLASGATERIPFAWHPAPGLAPPADLWIESNGGTALQVTAVGDVPFVRAGLDLVPLVSETPYTLILERQGRSLTMTIAGSKGAVLRAQAATSGSLDIVLPGRNWRSAIESPPLE
jgi:hypothetical protein